MPLRSALIDDARAFSANLCEQLGLPAESAIPAYEDAAHFILVEQKLPIGVTVTENTLEDEAERERLVRVFDRGLTMPASYVLPIQVWHSKERGRRWVTERWALRREKLFLAAGDSPAGYRLPLGSLASLTPLEFPLVLAARSVCRCAADAGKIGADAAPPEHCAAAAVVNAGWAV